MTLHNVSKLDTNQIKCSYEVLTCHHQYTELYNMFTQIERTIYKQAVY